MMRKSVLPSNKKKAEMEEKGWRRSLERTPSYTELFDAIGNGDEIQVLNILNASKDPIGLLRKKDLQGLTPLRKAIALSNGEIARILVMHGSDATQKGALNKEALHEAARMGQRSLLAPLLSAPKISVNVKDKFGTTPLHNAVRGRHVKAVEWLLFAGADAFAQNDAEESPVGMLNPDSEEENEKQINHLLQLQRGTLGPLDLMICCGYVSKKQICKMGGDTNIVFITSDMWPDQPQFIFGVRILPDLASPQIPLRPDELFYSYVFKYRLMYSLPENKRRVQIYFAVLEEFNYSELILKVCSKSKFIGEVPITITTYSFQQYINFMASCEMDLQNEGQFVLVKRPKYHQPLPDLEGILSIPKIPLFKFATTETTFAAPPADWGKNRRQLEWDEHEALIASLPNQVKVIEKEEQVSGDATSNNAIDILNKNANAEEENGEDEDSIPEDEAILLDWSEPDTCEDFYFISRGWDCYLERRCSMTVSTVTAAFPADVEYPIVRAITDFYRIHHPSNSMEETCIIQIPKTPEFVKVGTVLVFQRQELGPNQKEDPYPNSSKDEYSLSEDGRRTRGKVWLDREVKRWSLIPFGVVNKPTRVVFHINKLCTYVAVQLNIGEEKPELDSDESDSDEDSDDDEFGMEGGEEGEGGEAGEDGEEAPKKKKKKRKTITKANGEEGQEAGEEGDKSNNAMKRPDISNNNDALMETDVTSLYAGGIEPSDEEFAILLDNGAGQLGDGESSEDLATIKTKRTPSISVNNMTADGFVEYHFGEPRTTEEYDDEQMQQLLTQIALNWRHRNHRETRLMVFTRHRSEMYYDLSVEIIQESDLTVRAEAQWSNGYRMVALSPPFLSLIGKAYSVFIDGTLILEAPADGCSRALIFYSIGVNELNYIVKRKQQEEPTGPAKKMRKEKQDPMAVSNDIDARLELTCHPTTTPVDGHEVLKLDIPLTGPNLWTEKHMQLRIPDNVVLDEIVDVLKQEPSFNNNWWKVWILLHFDEKQVEVEKVKQDWVAISEHMLKRWFDANIDANDRGITTLITIVDNLRLEVAYLKLLGELKIYKRKTLDDVVVPRQLDLLFHWAKNTKMKAESFRKGNKELPVMSPLSDQYLMYLNEIIDMEDIFEFGPIMEVEDNVLHSINGEENITDNKYKFFKILIKARQKKDEIVAFTLSLTDMVVAIYQQEVYDFVVRETRRWMTSIIDTQPETCTKLENLLTNLAKTYERKAQAPPITPS